MNALEIAAVFLITLVFYMHIKAQLLTTNEAILVRLDDSTLASLAEKLRARKPLVFKYNVNFVGDDLKSFKSSNSELVERCLPRLHTRLLLEQIGAGTGLCGESAYRNIIFGPVALQLWMPCHSVFTAMENYDQLLGRYKTESDLGDPDIEVSVEKGEAISIPPFWARRVKSGKSQQLLCYTPLNVLAIKVKSALQIIGQ